MRRDRRRQGKRDLRLSRRQRRRTGNADEPDADDQRRNHRASAGNPKKDVYIAGGNFNESVNLADGVGLYGGYEPITGARGGPQVTTITRAPL